jgi:V8-like Glu-specific endopeptidase
MSTPFDSVAGREPLMRPALDIMQVVAPDDRVRVTKCDQYPWRCICSLRILARNGAWSSGTGWLVGPRVVLTAGQCVYLHGAGGWAAQVEVIPGRDGDKRPNGSAMSAALRSSPGWTEQHDFDYDYGAILLPPDQRLGDSLGWFGYTPREDDEIRQATLNVAGYPREGGLDAVEGSQWFASGPARQVDRRQISYEISTSASQAGSPVWEMNANGERYGVAIHSWGTRLSNGATRITREVFDDIARWVQEAA